MRFLHSLGFLFTVLTAFLDFEVNEEEYEVTGMAPYGESRYIVKIYGLIKVENDGTFLLDMSYFSYHYIHDKAFNQEFIDYFRSPKNPRYKANYIPIMPI